MYIGFLPANTQIPVGMGQYQKCLHWEAANAKPLTMRFSTPHSNMAFPVNYLTIKVTNAQKYETNLCNLIGYCKHR